MIEVSNHLKPLESHFFHRPWISLFHIHVRCYAIDFHVIWPGEAPRNAVVHRNAGLEARLEARLW